MSDVMHGPAVVVAGRRKQKTYLIGLLDDATRVVPYAAFALSESTAAFLPVLGQAVMRRGIPKRLYVDNGAAFRSHHLALVCAKLGITLIHARPYQPQGKGKQERFFRTVRMRFLPTLGARTRRSLDALNRRLWAWVEGEYHQAPHRGLDGTTPLDAWAMRSGDVRVPGPELDLREMFLFEQKRKVQQGPHRQPRRRRSTRSTPRSSARWSTVRFDPSKRGAPVDIWHARPARCRRRASSTPTPTASSSATNETRELDAARAAHRARAGPAPARPRRATTSDKEGADVPQALRPHAATPSTRTSRPTRCSSRRRCASSTRASGTSSR